MKRLTLLLIILLTACQTSPPVTAAPDPEQVLTLTGEEANLSSDVLTKRYGGNVILHKENLTLIGNPNTTMLSSQNVNLRNVQNNRDVFQTHIKKKDINLYGLGTVVLWGTGTVILWGSGNANANVQEWTQIGLPHLEISNTLGRAPVIAIIDSGIDATHPLFQNKLTAPSTWKDFVDDDQLPNEEGIFGSQITGHGTAVAGLSLIISPEAKIMPIRVLSPTGAASISDVTSGIVWAADHGADIINLSLGANVPVPAVQSAIAYANSKGSVIVAAAGNAGTEGLNYPAQDLKFPNLSVSSVNTKDQKSNFGQYGTSLSILAPGEQLISAAPTGKLAEWTGTSMSAPVVSGALSMALMKTGKLSQASDLLRLTAKNIDTQNPTFAGKLGSGVLNMERW